MPCVSSGDLISGCDPPGGCQPSRIPRSLGSQQSLLAVWYRMPVWGRDCPLPALAALTSLSPAVDGPVHSLLALLSPLFYELAWRCLSKVSKVKSLSRVQLFVTPWTVAYQTPLSWDFAGKSTGVGCHSLLQEIFLTQGLNPGVPHCRQMLYCLSHQGRGLLSG